MATAIDKLAKEVRAAREKAGLSQRELAAKLNMNQRTVIDLEMCRSNPKIETVFLIAELLHISLDALIFTGTAQPNAVSVEVLDFFSDKSREESEAYIRLCREAERLNDKKNSD